MEKCLRQIFKINTYKKKIKSAHEFEIGGYFAGMINQVIMDRYVLVSLIRHGKYSTYWLAWDSVVWIPVCLRVFRSSPKVFKAAEKLRESLNKINEVYF